MIHIITRILTSDMINSLLTKFSISSHHDDEGGHANGRKNNQIDWLAELLNSYFIQLPDYLKPKGFVGVDPWMKIYSLKNDSPAIPAHTDKDFEKAGTIAKYSILLRLNDKYQGGETIFEGILKPTNIQVGGGIVFSHSIAHEGRPVLSGEKLILKTDIFCLS